MSSPKIESGLKGLYSPKPGSGLKSQPASDVINSEDEFVSRDRGITFSGQDTTMNQVQTIPDFERKSFPSSRRTPPLETTAEPRDYPNIISECSSETGSIEAKRSFRPKTNSEGSSIIKTQPVPQKEKSLTSKRRGSLAKNVLPRRNSELKTIKRGSVTAEMLRVKTASEDPLLTSLRSIKMNYTKTPKTKPRIKTPEPVEPPRYAETAPSGRSKLTSMSSVIADEVSQLESMVEDEERTLRQLNSHFKQAEWEESRRYKQDTNTEARLAFKQEYEHNKRLDEEFRHSKAEAEAQARLMSKLNRTEEIEDNRYVKALQTKESKLRNLDDLRRGRVKSTLSHSTSDREGLRLNHTEEDIELAFGQTAAEHEERLDQSQLQARAGELRLKYSEIVGEKQRLLALLKRINGDS